MTSDAQENPPPTVVREGGPSDPPVDASHADPPSGDPPPPATWREWLGLAVLMVPVFMTAVDMTVLFLATPAIAADLAPSSTQMLWVLHAGDLVGAGLVLTMGRLAGRLGPRRLLILGMVVYGTASVLAASADDATSLVLYRALLGASAATVAPAGMSLLRRMFPAPAQLSVAIAIFFAAFSGGAALGPPLGGFLLDTFWWGAVFLANVPAALLVLAAIRLLPVVPGEPGGRVDLLSVLLSLGGIALTIFGLQEVVSRGPAPQYLVTVAVGLGLVAGFVRRQSRLADPLLDLALFRIPAFSTAVVVVLTAILAVAGSDMLFAQNLQVVAGLSPTGAGLVLVAPAAVSILGSLAAPLALRRTRPASAIAAGTLVAVAGAALVAATVTSAERSAVVASVVGASLVAAGLGLVLTVGSNLLISSAPVERVGSAAAMQDVAGGLGNVLGLAFLGSLGFWVYRTVLTGGTLPAGMTGAEVRVATESVGGALAVADTLPGAAGDLLRSSAEEAFGRATQAAYGATTVLLLALVVLVLWRMRAVRLG